MFSLSLILSFFLYYLYELICSWLTCMAFLLLVWYTCIGFCYTDAADLRKQVRIISFSRKPRLKTCRQRVKHHIQKQSLTSYINVKLPEIWTQLTTWEWYEKKYLCIHSTHNLWYMHYCYVTAKKSMPRWKFSVGRPQCKRKIFHDRPFCKILSPGGAEHLKTWKAFGS